MASGSLWGSARPLIIGRAASAVAGVALPAVLAQWLDQTSYGTYKQLYLVANLALYSLQLGLAQSLFYFVPRARTDEERRAFIGQTQVVLAGIGALTTLGLLVAAPLLATRFSNPQLGELALPLAVLGGALVAAAPFEIALTSRGSPAASAVALVATDLVRVVAMVSAVLAGHGIHGLAWATAGAAVVRWLASLVLAGGLRHLALDGARVRAQLTYSLPFGVAVLFLQQQMQLHQVYVSARATPAAFALYAVGCMQIPIVSLLYTPVSETLQVRLAALERTGETHRAGAVFAEAVEKLAMIFLPLCGLLIATARPGIVVLYGARYAAAAGVMKIAVLSVAVASLPVDGVFKARARTGALLGIYAGKLAVTWPAVAFGFHSFGMQGAVAAQVTVEAATKLFQLAIIASDLKAPVGELLGGRAFARSVGVAVLAGGVALLAASLVAGASEDRGVNAVACAVALLLAALVAGGDRWLRRRGAKTTAAPMARAA